MRSSDLQAPLASIRSCPHRVISASLAVLALPTTNLCPSRSIAVCMSAVSNLVFGLAGSTRKSGHLCRYDLYPPDKERGLHHIELEPLCHATAQHPWHVRVLHEAVFGNDRIEIVADDVPTTEVGLLIR
jgi:hypothetical protein